jgi:hypothetical protein
MKATVRKGLFQPAGMSHSGFDFTHFNSAAKTIGYFTLSKEYSGPCTNC